MGDLRVSRRKVLQGIGAVGALGALGVPTAVFAEGDDEKEETRVRWDIISVSTTGVISAGGQGSAKASDGSMITMTGSGTFVTGDPDEVTGGGTWTTFAPTGTSTGSGTYGVTTLVTFTPAPGTLTPPPATDTIGNPADASAGLVVLGIEYSDGSRGSLTVSCMLTGSPASILEGITASKDFVTFWNNVTALNTLFHIMREDEN